MSPEDAVNKPKFHHQWLPDFIETEKGFDAQTTAALKAMGYTVKQRGAIGRVELITISNDSSRKITAIADKRGDDAAMGY